MIVDVLTGIPASMSDINSPATGISYFTPEQNPPSGPAVNPQSDGKPIPKLF